MDKPPHFAKNSIDRLPTADYSALSTSSLRPDCSSSV